MKIWNRLTVVKKVLFTALFLLAVMLAYHFRLVSYGIRQGVGQLKIIMQTQPVAQVLNDPLFPDSLKQKIRLVQEIRNYAFDSLGLNHSENYTTVYDQKGKPVLWIVTACPPFELKAYEWSFPLLGNVSYKGFFDYEAAKKEESSLQQKGFDTSVDEVAGWSTLGWFKDPILSSMLERPEGSLSNLIIHELTHGTLYVKNNVDFNENLASFVGDKGAEKFLEYKYGLHSEKLIRYKRNKLYSANYTRMVLKYGNKLDSLYKSFTSGVSRHEKIRQKKKVLDNFKKEFRVFRDTSGYARKKSMDVGHINNTFFIDMKRYREDQDFFEIQFKEKFNSNFKVYLKYLKAKYRSL